MFKLIWNLLALVGLAVIAGILLLGSKTGMGVQDLANFRNFSAFDGKAVSVYTEMMRTLAASGNAAEATVWKIPVNEDLEAADVEETMRFIANDHNIKNVGELPLSDQVTAMTGEEQRYLKIFMFCDPLTAVQMLDFSDAYSAYLPCRISLVEDKEGRLWLYSLNMDMMIHGGKPLPPALFDEANRVKDIILDIMERGAEGDF